MIERLEHAHVLSVVAKRHVRRMRGGTQSQLLEADDGEFYVVKFQNNPQHRRVLVNELVCSIFLRALQIRTPCPALVHVTEEFVKDSPGLFVESSERRYLVEPGRHFGARYPGDPAETAVFDFLPDSLLEQVHNLAHFLGVLAFDKWISNVDGRQAVFFRERKSLGPRFKTSYTALIIDSGLAFNGGHWNFVESSIQGLYAQRLVYRCVQSLEDFQPWLEHITNFPDAIVEHVYCQVPPEWIAGEEDALKRLLERLQRRRKRVAGLLCDCHKKVPNLFPNWR